MGATYALTVFVERKTFHHAMSLRTPEAGERFVERTHAISGRIDEYRLETEREESALQRFDHRSSEGALYFVATYFDPGERAEMSHAADSEAKFAENLFAVFDGRQLFASHGLAVRNARTEAGGRGNIPRRKCRRFRERPNFGFRDAAFEQRTAHAEFLRRLCAGPVVARIVEICPIADVRVTKQFFEA